MDRNWEAVTAAAGIGLVAGMRSMMAPALVSRFLGGRKRREDGLPMRLLGHPAAPTVTAMLAAGELVADKLPFTPARTELPSLFGRTLSGVLCGAAIGLRMRAPVAATAAVGGVAAVASTFGMYHLRRIADRYMPDAAAAVAEDALAVALGRAVLK